ncbi:long-chain fatty acid--CoA ligase [Nocardia sp. NPDC051833]|uniref:AMP-dependent synthetase/ligase n=1 Tax=Nocardia sp. NPDC051833 TaxID=3155674 RepID=UPI0034413339
MTVALPTTLCEAFQRTAARMPDAVALRTPGDTTRITWGEYARRVEQIAAGLANLGVAPGDAVALMLTNRPEFHLVDTAAMHLGAVPFSIYNTNPVETIAYQLAKTGSRVIVCEKQFLPQIAAARAVDRTVDTVVVVDEGGADTVSLAELESNPLPGFDFRAAWERVGAEDVLTIIFTSGTTGTPKGVELTHANILSNIDGVRDMLDPWFEHRTVSYLPDAHIVNRWTCHYFPMIGGGPVTDLADPKQIVTALSDTRPTAFVGVPQVWYKIKGALEAQLAAETSPVKRTLATWAIDIGRQQVRAELGGSGGGVSPWLAARHRVADRLVLHKIRHRLGLDELLVGATGAAPIAPEALEFVLGLGLPVGEVYGMSELSAIATLNRPGRMRLGTVGVAARGVEVSLAEDGEILVRGPIVMKGYLGDPEQTAEAIDADGWVHTGDIGTVDADGFVSIVDRKKELIVNSGGKNMSPSKIEGYVKVACPLAGSVVAIGDARPYITALIALDPDAAAAYALAHGLTPNPAELATDPGIREIIDAGIRDANMKLARVEQIKKFVVAPVFWQPGGDELTPTGKLKRKPITAKYATEIDTMYSATR